MVRKNIFLKAAILTIIVFVAGMLLGFIIENYRISEIRNEYREIEIEWADAKLQSVYYQLVNPSLCSAAIDENLKFADRVYQEGLKLERYDLANKLGGEAKIDKQRYALLKTEFWLNSISLKQRCNATYANLVYFYVNNPTIKQKAEQDTQAAILKELKEKYGADLMLIPLPIDLDISMINIMRNAYNITDLPTLLINEKIKLDGVHSIEDIEKSINK